MFGLDARIALAIFGGLTIITGAALFSAISQTTATSQLVDLENLNKATTQYMLDTGQNPSAVSVLKNQPVGVFGWDGPYMNAHFTGGPSGIFANSKRYGMQIYVLSDAPWGAGLTDAAVGCTAVDSTCHYFAAMGVSIGIPLNTLVPFAIFESIEEIVDGNDGYGTGNFRVRELAGPRYIGYLKGPQRLR